MRDAFGGTFLMYMILIFVTIYVTFLAAALKYVQAYRVKNEIINYIEQYEGFNENVKTKLEGANGEGGYLQGISYNEKSAITNIQHINNIPTKEGEKYCSDYGYCVELKYCDSSDKDNKCTNQGYYKVTAYMALDFTNILSFAGPIKLGVSGETRSVTLEF